MSLHPANLLFFIFSQKIAGPHGGCSFNLLRSLGAFSVTEFFAFPPTKRKGLLVSAPDASDAPYSSSSGRVSGSQAGLEPEISLELLILLALPHEC